MFICSMVLSKNSHIQTWLAYESEQADQPYIYNNTMYNSNFLKLKPFNPINTQNGLVRALIWIDRHYWNIPHRSVGVKGLCQFTHST